MSQEGQCTCVRANGKRWGAHRGPETPVPTKFTFREQSGANRESRRFSVTFLKIRRENVFGMFRSIGQSSPEERNNKRASGVLEEESSNSSLRFQRDSDLNAFKILFIYS